jgi:hypothetical protein
MKFLLVREVIFPFDESKGLAIATYGLSTSQTVPVLRRCFVGGIYDNGTVSPNFFDGEFRTGQFINNSQMSAMASYVSGEVAGGSASDN